MSRAVASKSFRLRAGQLIPRNDPNFLSSYFRSPLHNLSCCHSARIFNLNHLISSFRPPVFSHLHDLDFGYHLSRETGGLNGITDHGTINFILPSTMINVVTTMLEQRTIFRKVMNRADKDANTRSIDSLMNYETVKYFSKEAYEADRYDEFPKS
ncbi:Iron-sulfur clusters transporter ABCB7 mitochondrial [Euphorbia peplus]|nr:Iron-sulfur clusters transporter ABCB7 mitochondrial [Euphorbia peplus]